jgi:tetratricopeptide (TPR) repeat protein
LKLQVLRGELKASKLKNTWSLATANLRASLYKKQGRIASAENMHRRVLEMNVKVMGQEHKSTLDAVFGLGLLYDEQDKLAEAELMYQRALTGREKTLRLEHESTLTPHTNLPVFTPNKIKWSKPK